ncbi:RNA polymerase sigma factor [Actinomadura darangshiensis]|nr:sigma-70 family RNA polymerase sigma factor [Actinomadura darangshiensis]
MGGLPHDPRTEAGSDPASDLFEHLHGKYRERVLRCIRRILGRSGIGIDDVAQETWIKVFERLDEIRTNPRAHILTIASHEAVNAIREASRLRSLLEEYGSLMDEKEQERALEALEAAMAKEAGQDGAAEQDGAAAPDARDDASAQRRALIERAWRAMDELSPRQRAVISMWIAEDPPPTGEEIGHHLDIGRKTAETHRRRGLQNLRRALEDQEPPESSSGGAEEGAQR